MNFTMATMTMTRRVTWKSELRPEEKSSPLFRLFIKKKKDCFVNALKSEELVVDAFFLFLFC